MTSSGLSSLSIARIEHRIEPLRDQLFQHPLYETLRTLEHLRLFMESHVFAVWDFMSLLKSLQRAFTCVDLPWVPTIHPASRRFINEIVFGEESDEYEGRPLSHFEIYLEAMRRAGADTAPIEHTIEAARRCQSSNPFALDDALKYAPAAARQFVETTFRIIRKGSAPAQAAAFTFGREDAIPSLFRSLVRQLDGKVDGDLGLFLWYLERHIEVDGDLHGPLSLRMVADLCSESPSLWAEAEQAAVDALEARLALWDGILAQIT